MMQNSGPSPKSTRVKEKPKGPQKEVCEPTCSVDGWEYGQQAQGFPRPKAHRGSRDVSGGLQRLGQSAGLHLASTGSARDRQDPSYSQSTQLADEAQRSDAHMLLEDIWGGMGQREGTPSQDLSLKHCFVQLTYSKSEARSSKAQHLKESGWTRSSSATFSDTSSDKEQIPKQREANVRVGRKIPLIWESEHGMGVHYGHVKFGNDFSGAHIMRVAF